MKRIYYGQITIDTTDEFADIAMQLAETALGRTRYRTQYIGGGGARSEEFDHGFTEVLTVSGYVNDADSTTDVKILITPGVHLAVVPVTSTKTNPVVDMTLPQAKAQLAEYHTQNG